MNELIFFSIGFLISLVSVLTLCICGCRKGVPKNDLLGLDGMVKITNPDENVNHLPAAGNYMSQKADDIINSDSDDHSKRPSGGSNPHRSLPDIPVLTSDNGVSGDTSSELYATVDDKAISLAFNKRHTLPNGVDSGPSLSHQSSISQSDSNYARLKENPYDKLKKSENPYSNVKSSNSKGNDESSREPSPQTSWNNIPRANADSIENVSVDQTILERGRRMSSQSSQNGVGNSSPVPDIPAATAVAGRVAASQDLPYMTPPITQPQHFSGDSQDSSRGYTSISVREPLANIMSQTPAIRNRRNELDPHYSTVSDDSDEMYAAIVEPVPIISNSNNNSSSNNNNNNNNNNNIYNGSETYAQIQPITIAEIHGHSTVTERRINNVDDDYDDDQYEPAPQPPSVDSLKHVAHVHSRQASSSSCTSSVANLGSPKPEKRQANSPLPPPPAVSPDLYTRIDKNAQDKDEINFGVVRNLEDMYAKVHKNKKKYEENSPPADSSKYLNDVKKRDSFDDFKHLDTLPVETTMEIKKDHCYETLNKDKKTWLTGSSSSSSSTSNGGNNNSSNTSNNNGNNHHANNNSGPESLLSNDPGYERLQNRRTPSESDPNYEVLRPQNRTTKSCELNVNIDNNSDSDLCVGYSTIGGGLKNSDSTTIPVPKNNNNNNNSSSKLTINCVSDDGYSIVNKKAKKKFSEPGYEEVKTNPDVLTVNNRSRDPGYEELKNTSSVCSEEPNYESMPHDESESDPNYESVKYLDVSITEPPYEKLPDDDNNTKGSSDLSSEYEQIPKTGTPDYERIKDNSNSKSSDNSFEHSADDRSSATPEYRQMKSSENSEDHSDSSKLSNNNDDIVVIEQQGNTSNSIIVTVAQEITDIKINIPKETTESGDIFHV